MRKHSRSPRPSYSWCGTYLLVSPRQPIFIVATFDTKYFPPRVPLPRIFFSTQVLCQNVPSTLPRIHGLNPQCYITPFTLAVFSREPTFSPFLPICLCNLTHLCFLASTSLNRHGAPIEYPVVPFATFPVAFLERRSRHLSPASTSEMAIFVPGLPFFT